MRPFETGGEFSALVESLLRNWLDQKKMIAAGSRNGVQVQVLSSAPRRKQFTRAATYRCPRGTRLEPRHAPARFRSAQAPRHPGISPEGSVGCTAADWVMTGSAAGSPDGSL